MPDFQHAQLLEVLEFFQRRARHRGQPQQEIAAIRVQPDVLIELWRVSGQQIVVPLASVRNRAAAEIQRPAARVEHHLDARWIVQLLARADRRGQRGHRHVGVFLEQLNRHVDRGTGQLRLVALDVDEDIDVGQSARRPRPRDRCRWRSRGWSSRTSPPNARTAAAISS